MQRKCCAHCPGEVTRTGEPAREHACGLPGYVAGRLGRAGLAQQPPAKQPDSRSVRFDTAKKFHAENLQHQPLPDRVDDAIFTVDKPAESPCMCDAVKRCQRIIPRRLAGGRKKEPSRLHRYMPALGCKAPTTFMDLAICWETPVDPAYEPARPVHIDGSDGGPAPAVFALVQHADSQVDTRDGCILGRRPPVCCPPPRCDKCAQQTSEGRDADEKEELCRHLDSISLAAEKRVRPAVGAAARAKRAEFLKHCPTTANDEAPARKPGRAGARSAACLQKRGCAVVERKNNGLAGRSTQVPRPRTPYARRSFCIDSLAPPFSIVAGCRDADYPEHWRLTSIYQQSYRNPKKMREGRTLLNYDRSY